MLGTDRYKSEPVVVKLEWWEVDCGDLLGIRKLTERQLDILLDAEAKNIRLVRFDDFVISVPYTKGAVKKKRWFRQADLQHTSIVEQDKIYIIEDTRSNKLLGGQ